MFQLEDKWMRTPDAFGSSTNKTLSPYEYIAYRIPKTHTFGASLEASFNLLTKKHLDFYYTNDSNCCYTQRLKWHFWHCPPHDWVCASAKETSNGVERHRFFPRESRLNTWLHLWISPQNSRHPDSTRSKGRCHYIKSDIFRVTRLVFGVTTQCYIFLLLTSFFTKQAKFVARVL
jgi:hypothetical protein